jgi:hypothetical protein
MNIDRPSKSWDIYIQDVSAKVQNVVSIFKLLLLILILTNVDIDFLFTSAHK